MFFWLISPTKIIDTANRYAFIGIKGLITEMEEDTNIQELDKLHSIFRDIAIQN